MNDFAGILFTTLYAKFEANKGHVHCYWKESQPVPVTLGALVVCAKGLLKVDFRQDFSLSDRSIDVLLPAVI